MIFRLSSLKFSRDFIDLYPWIVKFVILFLNGVISFPYVTYSISIILIKRFAGECIGIGFEEKYRWTILEEEALKVLIYFLA
jgi:hypothetical protein